MAKRSPTASKRTRKPAPSKKVSEPEKSRALVASQDPQTEISEESEDQEDLSEPQEWPDDGPSDAATLPTTVEDAEHFKRAVSPSDPLRRYLEEVGRHPLLAPEEEYKLAMELREKGDIQAAKKLVSANLRLVVKIAFEYRNFYNNLLDLIQEGNIGLMKAVSKFDPSKGASLGYYGSWWIRSYILKYLLDNFRLVKVGTTQAQKKLFYHLMREKSRLEAQGIVAGPKLLAEKLEVREKDVVEMEQRLSGSGAEMSLDAPIYNDGGRETFASALPDHKQGTEDSLVTAELLKILRDRLPEFEKTLNPKEQNILKERLLSEEPLTLQEIADKYSLTRERVRQLEVRVLSKLRNFLGPSIVE